MLCGVLAILGPAVLEFACGVDKVVAMTAGVINSIEVLV